MAVFTTQKSWRFLAELRQQGFSIVQVMVAFALMGALAVGMMKMVENMQRSQRYSEVKNEELLFQNLVGDYLKNPNACSAALSGAKVGDTFDELHFVIDGANNPKWNEVIPGTRLKIELLQIASVGEHVGGGVFPITLRIGLRRNGGAKTYNMAGTTKNLDFTVLVKMCSQTAGLVFTQLQYDLGVNMCDAVATGESAPFHYYEPDSFSGPAMLQCNICNSTKPIINCSNAL